jgi:uncharacterized protein YqeY
MLKQKIQADLKEAFKSGDADRKSVVSMLLAAIKSREIEKRAKVAKSESDAAKLDEMSQLNDEEIMEAIGSEIKKRKDSISQYESAGRPELAEKEKKEADILISYLPEQMPEAELKELVEKTKSEVGAAGPKDMGKLIGAVMAKVKGKADGTLVSRLVKEALN